MNAAPFWFLQSLAVGALAAACVALCPASLRSRVRQAVPVAAFATFVLLVGCLFLPKLETGALRTSMMIPVPEALSSSTKAGVSWLMEGWMVGCAIFLLRLAAGSWTVWCILRTTQPVPGRAWKQLMDECQRTLGLRGRVRLRLAGPGFVPSAAGLFRRTVLLPDEALHWTREQRKLVLLHELGHFRRGDLWAHALGRLACALHWFNPFAWMLQRHLAVEREFACDELVVARGAAPDDYATLLFEMATAARRRPMLEAAFLTMASRRTGKLEARVLRILEPVRKSRRWQRVLDGTLCATLTSLLVVCAAAKPESRDFGLHDKHAKHAPSSWTKPEVEMRLAAEAFPE